MALLDSYSSFPQPNESFSISYTVIVKPYTNIHYILMPIRFYKHTKLNLTITDSMAVGEFPPYLSVWRNR